MPAWHIGTAEIEALGIYLSDQPDAGVSIPGGWVRAGWVWAYGRFTTSIRRSPVIATTAAPSTNPSASAIPIRR